MGSAGHAFISHTKALSPPHQTKDGGYGSPPHPLSARPGQRYWPRRGRRKRPFVVRAVKADVAIGIRLDGQREPVHVTLSRLLERREDGQGLHYQFHGWTSRRYETFARVEELDDRAAVLCLPEWHPRRPVTLFTSLIPCEARRSGAWLALRCDLAATSAAALQPSNLRNAVDPNRRLPRPAVEMAPRQVG